jgi:methylamine dehydrogenase accessory protein MauD
MTDALLVSNIVLWAVVLTLAGVVLLLVRQIGVLYERIAPIGALLTPKGPTLGAPAPMMSADAIAGAARVVGGARADGRSTLLFFLSPTCPVCKELLPSLRSVARAERAWLDVVLASDGPRTDHERFITSERLEDFPYVVSTALGLAYHVVQLPYAVLIDGAGVLRAKGLVNTREHLESLFEAGERGVGSLQEYVRGREHAAEGARP